MAVNEIDLVKDSTMQQIAYAVNKLAGLTEKQPANFADIKKLVETGNAKHIFNIGDQINVPWTDRTTGKQYIVPLDVVHHGTATLKNGEEVPAMYLQWHFATPFGVQFSANQAFYKAVNGLAAGTYNIEIGTSWGSNCVAGKKYQFTLTKDVPAGGQLAGLRGAPDQAPSNWRVYSYASNAATEALETVTLTEGSGGTSLGSIISAGNDAENLNSLQRAAYGNNRWAHSAMRQWLNSDKAANQWWKPQNAYDRAPDQINKAGFLSGFEADFLEALTPVKVTTALSTLADTDVAVGATEDTYDKVFLPSLQQMYINPQASNVEGEAWDYWKRVLGRTTPAAQYGTYPEFITYALEVQTSPQYVLLRSAYRGNASYAWYVGTSGYVYYSITDTYAWRCAPACVITGI